MSLIEIIGRYIDGTLQDRGVHACDVDFSRVDQSGRDVPDGWACDFDVVLEGQRARVTLTFTKAGGQS